MKLSSILADKGIQIFGDEMKYHAVREVTRIWIVVADQEKAHVYRKIIADGVALIATASAAETKQAGSAHTAYARARSLLYRTNRHVRQSYPAPAPTDDFLQKLAGWLNEAEQENAFDRLVLIAPAHTLNALRPVLSEKAHERIMTELDKDMAGLSDEDIRSQLAEIIRF